MKHIIYTLLFAIPAFGMAQDCAPFTAEANGKPVKITFYTETDQCFSLSGASGAINPTPSKRVVYYMNYGTEKTQLKLANGTTLSKNVMMTNEAMASMTYEVVFNEKKAEWDIKGRLGQADVTEAEKAQRDADFQKSVADQKAKQEADQKAWDDKRAAEKAERERESAEAQPKYTIQKVDTKVNTDIQKVDTHVNTDIKKIEPIEKPGLSKTTGTANGAASSSSMNDKPKEENTMPSSASNGDGTSVTKGKYMTEIVVVYKETPVANTYMTLGLKEFNYGTCLTDGDGYCKLYSEIPVDCNGPIDLKGYRGGSTGGDNASASSSMKWSIGGFYIINCDKPSRFRLEQAAQAMSEMMGGDAESIARGWGVVK